MIGLCPWCNYRSGQLFMTDALNLLNDCSVGTNDFSIGDYTSIYEASLIHYQWEYHGRHALIETVAMQQRLVSSSYVICSAWCAGSVCNVCLWQPVNSVNQLYNCRMSQELTSWSRHTSTLSMDSSLCIVPCVYAMTACLARTHPTISFAFH